MNRILKDNGFEGKLLGGADRSSKARLLLKRGNSYAAVCEHGQQIHAVAVLGALNLVVDNKSSRKPLKLGVHDQMILSGIYSEDPDVRDKAREWARDIFDDLFRFPCSITSIFKITRICKTEGKAKLPISMDDLSKIPWPKHQMKKNAWKRLKRLVVDGQIDAIQTLANMANQKTKPNWMHEDTWKKWKNFWCEFAAILEPFALAAPSDQH